MCNNYYFTYDDFRTVFFDRFPDASEDDCARSWNDMPDYHKAKEIRELKVPTKGMFDAPKSDKPFDRWIIRKTGRAPFFRLVDGAWEPVLGRWGFDRLGVARIKNNAVNNTRSDSLRPGGMWDEAWQERRCLIPASGIYEWKQVMEPGKEKPAKTIPHAIRLPDGEPMMIAGVYEESDEHGPCFSMMTTSANEAMRGVHDRMPVILPQEGWDAFLSDVGAASDLLVPYTGKLEVFECVNPLTKAWIPGPPKPAI